MPTVNVCLGRSTSLPAGWYGYTSPLVGVIDTNLLDDTGTGTGYQLEATVAFDTSTG